MASFTIREEILEIVHKLFWYTDSREWEKLENEVFSKEVFYDLGREGDIPSSKTFEDICSFWKKEYDTLDSIHHITANHLVQVHEATATVTFNATASHFKASATNGSTRSYMGRYRIELLKHGFGWRIYELKYERKFASGNLNLS